MRKIAQIPQDVLSRLPEAFEYLSNHPQVEFACLFGGLARREPSPLSDIDIAVYLSESAKPAKAKLQILGALMEIFMTDEIDLVVLNTAPLSLRGRILANRLTIADRNPFFRHRYESLTMREFFDFSVYERIILKRRYLHG
jgi:hypothetical protein